MKLNKIFLMAGIALMGLFATSCGDDDDYSAGAETGKYKVTFAGESQANRTLSINDTVFTFNVIRSDATSALTVPLNKIEVPSCFTLPSSVTFAPGEDTVEVKVKIDTASIKTFYTYNFVISIPEGYTDQYSSSQTTFPRLSFQLVREDYKPYGVVKYKSAFYRSAFNQTVEYSKILGIYRLADLWADGHNLYFKWNGKTDDTQKLEVVDENGQTMTGKFFTGVRTYYFQWKGSDDTDNPTYIDSEGYFIFSYELYSGTTDYGVYQEYFYFLSVN